jgi:hypothetical protein
MECGETPRRILLNRPRPAHALTWVKEVSHWHEVIPPQARVVSRLAVCCKAAVRVAMHHLCIFALCVDGQAEEAPASALGGGAAFCVLALQAHAQVVRAAHRGLVDGEPQGAVA